MEEDQIESSGEHVLWRKGWVVRRVPVTLAYTSVPHPQSVYKPLASLVHKNKLLPFPHEQMALLTPPLISCEIPSKFANIPYSIMHFDKARSRAFHPSRRYSSPAQYGHSDVNDTFKDDDRFCCSSTALAPLFPSLVHHSSHDVRQDAKLGCPKGSLGRQYSSLACML